MMSSDIYEDQPSIIDELPHGYKLKSILQDEMLFTDDKNAPNLTNAAFFPWHKDSLKTLWGGKRITTWANTTNQQRRKVPRGTLPAEDEPISAEEVWLRIIRKWMGCVAIYAGDELRLVQTRDNVLMTVRHLKTGKVGLESGSDNVKKKGKRVGAKSKEEPINEIPKLRAVTWALDFDTLHPLVVFAGDQAIIRIVDVESWERVGAVTGHGGPITHLTTHPIRPNYILSTSEDWTARMWSLADPVDTTAAPAYWPGMLNIAEKANQKERSGKSKRGGRGGRGGRRELTVDDLDMNALTLEEEQTVIPSNALVSRTGPAGGVPDRDRAGHGKGVCIAVFKGTAAGLGGHQSWVMCADFHPTKPFVITGGADRAVKIWRIPDFPTPETQPLVGVNFSTVELPLFSCTHLHEGAVDFIRWVTPDLVISKSKATTTNKNDFNGTVQLWRWLDLKRFAPDGYEPKEWEVKPSFQDYHESRSYMKVADLKLPREGDEPEYEWRLDVCPTWPDLVLASETDTVHVINMHKHMCTPTVLAARKRKFEEDKSQRRAKTREVYHPVDLVELPHFKVRVRGRDGELGFQILRAMMNPLDPRVLLGMGQNGVLVLWYEDDDTAMTP
ncbi:hypothetical protein FRC12_025109 [Ceratobasidium sp. 428]|nr:hypothetical protein FRC12_025109 [Ceratobasidium sp. 428]